MAIDLASIRTSVRGWIAWQPLAVTYGSETIDCAKGLMTIQERAITGGLLESYLFSLYSVAADWTTKPAKEQVVTIDGTNYRILREVEYAQGAVLRWDMGTEYQT